MARIRAMGCGQRQNGDSRFPIFRALPPGFPSSRPPSAIEVSALPHPPGTAMVRESGWLVTDDREALLLPLDNSTVKLIWIKRCPHSPAPQNLIPDHAGFGGTPTTRIPPQGIQPQRSFPTLAFIQIGMRHIKLSALASAFPTPCKLTCYIM
jgi:hypothetical protein